MTACLPRHYFVLASKSGKLISLLDFMPDSFLQLYVIWDTFVQFSITVNHHHCRRTSRDKGIAVRPRGNETVKSFQDYHAGIA
jgi:hypothetical protein